MMAGMASVGKPTLGLNQLYSFIFGSESGTKGLDDRGKLVMLVFFTVFTVLGGIVWARLIRGAIFAFFNAFVRPAIPPRFFGTWAVVTGCTDGIGLAFAEQLASEGINLVLVSRTQSKLDELATRLTEKHGIRTKAVAVDLADMSPARQKGLEAVARAVGECQRDLGLLINNAGMSYPHAQYMHEVTDDLVQQLIQINVVSMTDMIRMVLPAMLARKRGCIVNVGSGAGTVLPSDPLYSVYAGTKAYADALTRSLAVEYAEKGVRVQLVAPLYVSTKMSKIRRQSLFTPSPATYVRHCMQRLGRDTVTTAYPMHGLMAWGIQFLPTWVMDMVRLNMRKDLRARALAKRAGASGAAAGGSAGGKKDE